MYEHILEGRHTLCGKEAEVIALGTTAQYQIIKCEECKAQVRPPYPEKHYPVCSTKEERNGPVNSV